MSPLLSHLSQQNPFIYFKSIYCKLAMLHILNEPQKNCYAMQRFHLPVLCWSRVMYTKKHYEQCG